MRLARYLLVVLLLISASCRNRGAGQMPIVDPFLPGRSTTVPPPVTGAMIPATVSPGAALPPMGTIAPAGTIQPYDPYNTAPATGTTTTPVLPPGSIPAGTFPPNNSFPTGSAAPGTTISPYSGSQYSPVEPANKLAGGWTSAASSNGSIIPSSASPGYATPANYSLPSSTSATDIMQLPSIRR